MPLPLVACLTVLSLLASRDDAATPPDRILHCGTLLAVPGEAPRREVSLVMRDGEIADVLLEKYTGVADRVLFPVPADPANDDAARRAIEKLRAG